jgi:hypothetical protein
LGHNLAMPPSDSEANGTDRDVLTSLPRTRPARRSAKRDRPAPAGGASSDASRSSRAAGSAGGASGGSAAAGGSATSSGSGAEPKPAAEPRATSSRAKAKPAASGAKASRARSAGASRSRAASSAKPRARATAAVAGARAGESAVPPAGYATEASTHGHAPDPFAVVTTAVQAAGEIAQIGATLWGQAMRSAISRLPRP